MLVIKGIYDGKTVKPELKIKTHKQYNVVITFLDEVSEPIEDYGLREFSEQKKGFEFWKNPAEDLYQDYLPMRNLVD